MIIASPYYFLLVLETKILYHTCGQVTPNELPS